MVLNTNKKFARFKTRNESTNALKAHCLNEYNKDLNIYKTRNKQIMDEFNDTLKQAIERVDLIDPRLIASNAMESQQINENLNKLQTEVEVQ